MKKVIITGATGFIGGSLARYLLKKNVTVYGVDINADKLEALKKFGDFIPVVADFSKYSRLHEMIDDKEIDVFYHFAWQGVFGVAFKDYKMQLNNASYTCDALMEAVEIGCKKFVFAGTINEYEMNKYISANYFEPRYTYIYSAVKQVSEAICKTLAYNLGIEYNCGRIAMAYGENNYSMMIPNVVMKNLLSNTPCNLIEGNDLYDMVYVDDIVRAFEAIGDKGKNMKSYYIGHRNITTFKIIIENIAQILNPNCPLLFGKYPDAPSGVDYENIDLDALYQDTGFECRADFKESIMKTADWLKSIDSANFAGGGYSYLVIISAARKAAA